MTTYASKSSYSIKTAGEMRYLPFGETRWASGELYTDRRFTGQRWEAGLGGLYDYGDGTHFYSPALGRFISPDSLVPDPLDPQSYNRYAYARNAPTNYTDPSGHWVESALDIASIGYDVYDISQNGLNWENGLSLAADVVGLALPVVTGGGLAVRAGFKLAARADDIADIARPFAKGDGIVKQAVALTQKLGRDFDPIATDLMGKGLANIAKFDYLANLSKQVRNVSTVAVTKVDDVYQVAVRARPGFQAQAVDEVAQLAAAYGDKFVDGVQHAEHTLYDAFKDVQGFAGKIGVSHYLGPCDVCRQFFTDEGFLQNIFYNSKWFQ